MGKDHAACTEREEAGGDEDVADEFVRGKG